MPKKAAETAGRTIIDARPALTKTCWNFQLPVDWVVRRRAEMWSNQERSSVFPGMGTLGSEFFFCDSVTALVPVNVSLLIRLIIADSDRFA
jgi:hypothetical protein